MWIKIGNDVAKTEVLSASEESNLEKCHGDISLESEAILLLIISINWQCDWLTSSVKSEHDNTTWKQEL
jgi:hypothetical protein